MNKKKSIISVNLSLRARTILQSIGYIDCNLKKKGDRSLSKFISSLIVEFSPVLPKDAQKKALLLYLQDITEKRNKLDLKISKIVKEIKLIK